MFSRQTITDLFHYLLPGRAHARAAAHFAGREPELAILFALTDPSREAIDVGANIGLYAAALAPLVVHVHAIEAHPRLARVLSGVPHDNVTVWRRAASTRGGDKVRLAVQRQGSRELDGFSRVVENKADASDRIFEVETIALDFFADRPIGFVKIDVEGHEVAVLEGATTLIERQHPVFLIETEARHRPGAPFDIFARMARHRYTGHFLHHGLLHPIDRFTPDLQDASAFERDPHSAGAQYINNFVFVPPGFDLSKAEDLVRQVTTRG